MFVTLKKITRLDFQRKFWKKNTVNAKLEKLLVFPQFSNSNF